MSVRLRQIVSWWFVLQIIVPFTAPLQTLDVLDLFGARTHHRSERLPESTTTPTMSEAGGADACTPMRVSITLPSDTCALVRDDSFLDTLLHSASAVPPALHNQQSVLRL